MMLPITRCVQPDDLTCGACGGQRVQHCENGCRADPGTEQYDWPLSRLQHETSARRADVEAVAHLEMLLQLFSSRSIRFDLHADSITLAGKWTGERVAAKKRAAAGGGLQPHDDVLTWQWHGKLVTVSALQGKGENVRGLAIDCGDDERLKS